jgi:hypothetical protein
MKSTQNKFDIPILIIIFNRPEATKKILNAVKAIKPSCIYIAADGPRPGNKNDTILCKKTREIVEKYTQNITVKRLFHNLNLGCGPAYSTAINWFFKQVESGIILEDDCLPNESFFFFCKDLLKRYKDDERIMSINGTNHAGTWHPGRSDYFYSYFGSSWGWATWRRAWKHFDYDLRLFKTIDKICALKNMFTIKKEYKRKMRNYKLAYEGKISTMSYRWDFAMMINSGLTIVPAKNLIQNIGYGHSATHTQRPFEKVTVYKMNFPLHHPVYCIDDKQYARFRINQKNDTIIKKIVNRIKNFFYLHSNKQ